MSPSIQQKSCVSFHHDCSFTSILQLKLNEGIWNDLDIDLRYLFELLSKHVSVDLESQYEIITLWW